MELWIWSWKWNVKTVLSVITEHKHCIYCLFTSCLLQKEDISLFLLFFSFLHTFHCSLITLTQVCNDETRSKLTAKTYKNIKRTKSCLLSRLLRFKKIRFKKCHMRWNSRSVHYSWQTLNCLLHSLLSHMLLFFPFGKLYKKPLGMISSYFHLAAQGG